MNMMIFNENDIDDDDAYMFIHLSEDDKNNDDNCNDNYEYDDI